MTKTSEKERRGEKGGGGGASDLLVKINVVVHAGTLDVHVCDVIPMLDVPAELRVHDLCSVGEQGKVEWSKCITTLFPFPSPQR